MRTSNVLRRLAIASAIALGPAVPHLVLAQTTRPATLLVNTHPSGQYVYDGIVVGGAVWKGTTNALQAAFGTHIETTLDLANLSLLSMFDALWVDQRYASAPTALEIANLQAFAATGKPVVIIGENATWGPWNAAILGAFGGAEATTAAQFWARGWGDGCKSGLARTVGSNALTTGVTAINMACGGHAAGGTALFDYNVATLWGPQQNVLTILDANIFDDRYIAGGDGARFRQNVITWLNAPIAVESVAPEPSSLVLAATGLLALGLAARRRRAA